MEKFALHNVILKDALLECLNKEAIQHKGQEEGFRNIGNENPKKIELCQHEITSN